MTDELRAMPFSVEWRGRTINVEPGIPVKPVRVRQLLPLVQQIANATVKLAEKAVQDAGKAVTCRAGCGACCRQLVPVSHSEAHELRENVGLLPEPLQTKIRDRFSEGIQRLDEAGMLERVRHADETEDRLTLGREYFQLGIPCPFLEDESCSIHPDRPLSCREYLVTSPAELCRSEHESSIRKVLLPARTMPAFAALDGPGETVRWVPLILALEFAESNPEPAASAPGTELFERFVRGLQPGSAS